MPLSTDTGAPAIQRPISGQQELQFRPVSRVSFSLTDRSAFEMAVDFSLSWLQGKTDTALNKDALDRQSFDMRETKGAHPCHAIRINDARGTVWAARIDEPGSRPEAGETWSTEIFVERQVGQLVRFGAQLATLRPRDAEPLRLSRPRLIYDLLRSMSCEADEEPINEAINPIDSSTASTLASLIYKRGRRLPIVAVSTDKSGNAQLDLRQLAIRLSGAAHIVSLNPEGSWELSRLITRKMSVFNGAVRLYMPGIIEDEEDPFEHPLWLSPSSGWNSRLIDAIGAQVFPLGFRDRDGESRFWHIAQLRQAASAASARKVTGTEVDIITGQLTAARDQIASLNEKASVAEALMYDEAEQCSAAKADVARLKDELDKAKTTIYGLRSKIEQLGVPTEETPCDRRLSSYDDLEEWSAEVLGPHILIHKKALRDCRQNGHPDMMEKIERTLLAIRDHWVPSKLKGGLQLKEASELALATLGVDDEFCFKQRDKAKNDPEYSVKDGAVTRVLYDHFKFGNSRSNAEQFRIYYSWDENNRRIIIGKMPSHLTTSIS
jgi:hypothetical protein